PRRCAARARRMRTEDPEAGRAFRSLLSGIREDMLRPPIHAERNERSTMAFEEIAPRELRPEVYELDGISRVSVEAHYKLYQGYVNKRNEILGKLADVDLSSANQVYSELRALKVDLTFAIGGIKNHELYFE